MPEGNIQLTVTEGELEALLDALNDLNDKARHGELYHYEDEDHAALNSVYEKVHGEAKSHGMIY